MIRIPYSHVVAQMNDIDSSLSISAPWIQLDIEVIAEDKEWVTDAVHSWTSNPQADSLQKCLETLKDFPLWYAAPQMDPSAFNDIEDFDISINIQSPQKCSQSYGVSKDLSKTLPTRWEWDLQEIQKATQIPNHVLYDPKSVTTYLIGKCLAMDAVGSSHDFSFYLETLRKENEAAFFKIMILILRQTHYITHCFSKTVSPALTSFSQAFDVIEEFIQEEKGHEFLMSRSLKELGIQDPTAIPVRWEISCMMDIFKEAATKCPLAFANLVSFFEGTSYGESDPLGDVLRKSSKPKAAKGYDVHFKINKDSNHAGEIFKLMERLPLQSKNSITHTVRILELMMHLRKKVEDDLIADIKGFLAA